ncbi:MAG: hypothetical protein ABIH92_05610 [Nanoarchaeota archaeon]
MAGKKEPTLDQLLKDLNSFADMRNDRFAILGLQLYAEHYVNEIVMEQLKEPARKEVRKHLTFPQKLRILERMEIVDKKRKHILEKLNSIRDLLIHELVISEEDIRKKLEGVNLGFQYAWSVRNESGKLIKSQMIDLEDSFKNKIKDKYNQLIISCVILIGILYHNLMNLRGRPCSEFIEVTFKKKGDTKWEANLIINKLVPPNQNGEREKHQRP